MTRNPGVPWGTGAGLLAVLLNLGVLCPATLGQSTSGGAQASPAQITSSTYQGSLTRQAVVPGVMPLSLDQAIQMGLQYNLGLVLSGTNSRVSGAQQLQQLQALLPTVTASAKESVQQVDLQAEGLSFQGFPKVIGPFAYTDIRGAAVHLHQHPSAGNARGLQVQAERWLYPAV